MTEHPQVASGIAKRPKAERLGSVRAMRTATLIYFRSFFAFAVAAWAFMAIPSVLYSIDFWQATALSRDQVATGVKWWDAAASSNFLAPLPSDPRYLVVNFENLLAAVLIPLALAATIFVLADVVSGRKVELSRCFARLRASWLSIIRFGLVVLLVFSVDALLTLRVLAVSPTLGLVAALLVVTIDDVGTLACVPALVVLLMDGASPLRAFLSGARLLLRRPLAVLGFGACAAFLVIADIAAVFVAPRWGIVGSAIQCVSFLIFAPWLTIGLALFAFESLAEAER